MHTTVTIEELPMALKGEKVYISGTVIVEFDEQGFFDGAVMEACTECFLENMIDVKFDVKDFSMENLTRNGKDLIINTAIDNIKEQD